MSFNYDPITKEAAEKERYSLLDDGEYDAVVEKATDRISSSGNPMIELILSVYDKSGSAKQVYDFLVFTPKMMWKIIHFCESASLVKEYEEKKLCSEIIEGKYIRLKLTIKGGSLIPTEKLNGKPEGSRYPDKNSIEDYVLRIDNKKSKDSSPTNDFNDDVPF